MTCRIPIIRSRGGRLELERASSLTSMRSGLGDSVTSFSMIFAAKKHEARRLYVGNLGTIVMTV